MNSETKQTVASPLSTGSAGTFFEQNVGAFFLSLLAVRAIPPIAKDCYLYEVHFQANRLGWHTDDLLLRAMNSKGESRQLALQVKRQFTVSAKKDDSKKTFTDFWNDFRHNKKFNSENDKLALIVLRGTNTLLQNFNYLLDSARASIDGADFYQRLETRGLISKQAQEYEIAIRSIIEEKESSSVSNDDMRNFLACMHVISLDLNTETSLTESLIKSLLASSTTESDPQAAANTTWSELLQLVASESGGMPVAASYSYSQLPESIRIRHNLAIDTGPLQTLREHSQVIADSICSTIAGKTRIERNDLFSELLSALNKNQVVVISSPAGFGKSALAKELYQHLSRDIFCLIFRAEEFADSHIDNMLSAFSAGVTAKRLFALLAGQGQITIFVESIERLLEATVRDAFSDLLHLIKTHQNLQLILTCRDYSIGTIQSSLLEQNALIHHILEVPPFTDDQLDQVAIENKNIAKALKNSRLKELLRSPYMLNKAANMDWSDTTGASYVDESVFRKKCWSEVICVNTNTKNGINRRRERTFLEVAVRRAKALVPYVRCNDIDDEALQALINDDLITLSCSSNSYGAPSHDVLEDWATIQWIENEFLEHVESIAHLTNSISGLPALRRGYRKWLSEKIICEPDTSDQYIINVFSDELLPAYFRDDTIVCMLLSGSAKDFLTRQAINLLKDRADSLIRVIHLLRVACKSLPHWLNVNAHVPSVLLQPKGNAWAAVISIVKDAINDLLPENTSLILGLLEDWSKSVTWQNPEPAGFQDAGIIAYSLLQHLEGYRRDDQLKRALKIIAKIPKSNPEAFNDLIDRACQMNREDTVASEFTEIILPAMDGYFCCRDYPDEIIRLMKSAFFLTDEDIRKAKSNYHYSSGIDVDDNFGLRHYAINDNFFPPSAIRGPFRSLLTYHPIKGINFIIELLNHTSSWYGEQRWPYNPLEKPWQVTLKVPDDGEVVQWASSRLWGAYRGMSLNPHLVEIALMALEDWLLTICDMDNVDIESWILSLLKRSNNIAITAVIASICNAHPEKAGKAGIAILSSKDLIEMDRSRMVGDYSSSSFFNIFPDINVENKIYNEERKKSSKLPHRSNDLEVLASKLQLSDQREYVWQLIDEYRQALPSLSEQTDEHKIWRLALHRMDVRGYQPVEPENQPKDEENTEVDNDQQKRVYYGPGGIEPDVQAIVDNHAPIRAQQEKAAKLFNWGLSAWDSQYTDRVDTSIWQKMLNEAKEYENDSDLEYIQGCPGFIASVCVRDNWESMDDNDREWCVTKLIEELMKDCDSTDHTVQVARSSMRPDRSAAFVLPMVMVTPFSGKLNPQKISDAVTISLTHASTEVQAYAAAGIGHYLGEKAPKFQMKCMGALAMQARLQKELQKANYDKPYMKREPLEKLYAGVKLTIRNAIKNDLVDIETEMTRLDLTGWPGHAAARLILRIFSYTPDVPQAIDFYRKIADHFVAEWNAKSEDHDHRQDYQFELFCREMLAGIVLKAKADVALQICEPIIEATIEHPKNTAEFIHSLISAEDKHQGDSTFWLLWQKFADHVGSASWLDRLDTRWHRGQELVDRLFLATFWKEEINHWKRLDGNAHRLDNLIQQLSGSTHALQAYCRFLYDIGEQSLPNGYKIIANQLTPNTELDSNCIFHIETLLSRHVYGEPLKLKSDPKIQKSIIHILDHLVEQGSSAAYRMRDDFVTPLSTSE